MGGAVLAVLVIGVSGCDEPKTDLSTQTLDEQTARSSLAEPGVAVPDGFRFVGGLNQPSGFPGSSSNYVRFDGPAEVFDDPAPVAAANPEFFPFREVNCRIPLLAENGYLHDLGMPCTASTKVRLSHNSDAADDTYMPMGAKALALVTDPGKTELYVIVEGT